MKRMKSSARNWILLIGVGALAFGCVAPTHHLPSHISEVEGEFSIGGEAAIQDEWWKSFEDKSLNALIELALTNNFSLAATWDRFAQAEAQARIAGADTGFFLEGRAGASTSRERDDGNERGAQRLSLGIFASYELDLWGRVGAAAEAELLEAEASREDVSIAALSLAAEVSLSYFASLEARDEILVLTRQRANNDDALKLLRLQFANGQAGAADILRLENVIEGNEGDIAFARREFEILQAQLSVLVGASPLQFRADEMTAAGLPDAPPLPKTGLPSVLLRRRPDMRAAELRVLSADRSVAEAIADRYPRVSISASVETSGKVSDLFDNWLANLAGNLVQPLIDGGERVAVVEREKARLSALINDYSQSVLSALQEVEEAALRETQTRDLLASTEKRRVRAVTILERVRESFINQQSEYINVLDAISSLQALEREIIRTRQDLLAARVSLLRALAGSPELTPPAPRDGELALDKESAQ